MTLSARAARSRSVALWALACIVAAHVAIADPASATPQACEVANPQEARVLADRLFEQGEYQRAGVCYQAAGDMARANLAFLKAAGPESEDTARGLKAQRDAAKALFAKVANTFRGSH